MSILKNNEPLSSLSHFVGFGLSIAGLVLLIVSAVKLSTAWHVVSFSVFGASLILLYLASTIYHAIPKNSKFKQIFRRIDLSLIFILIAGTYTPIALVPLRGAWGWTIFGLVWGGALLGVAFQILKIELKLSALVLMYVLMGWIVIIALPALLNVLTPISMIWLFAGGLFYTFGAVFIVLDRIMSRAKWFGMHEIFHLFVLAGSFSHFWLIYKHIMFLA